MFTRFAAVEASRIARWVALGVVALMLMRAGFAASPLNWQAGPGFRSAPLPVPRQGKTGFTLLPSAETGIQVYGEQRGAAVGDFDADGRLDLVVTQNGAATKLYHNVGAKPGLCVRLDGPAGNPNGVGASVCLIFGEHRGPVREIALR